MLNLNPSSLYTVQSTQVGSEINLATVMANKKSRKPRSHPGKVVDDVVVMNNSDLCDSKTVEYLRDLIAEKDVIDTPMVDVWQKDNKRSLIITKRLIEQEIHRIRCGGKPPGRETKFTDVYHEKPIKITSRVVVPVKENPKFNFVGKLLGPRGNSLKRLQEVTGTKMAILGKGSMKDKEQEEKLRSSGDLKFNHLNDDLHVEISTFATPAEAHLRTALALHEIRRYLIPDGNDDIRKGQIKEFEAIKSQETDEDQHSECSSSSFSNAAGLGSMSRINLILDSFRDDRNTSEPCKGSLTKTLKYESFQGPKTAKSMRKSRRQELTKPY